MIRTPIGELVPGYPLCAEFTIEELPGKDRIIRKRVKAFYMLSAIELHSKLMGHFEPDRKEIELNNSTLMSIKERAAEVGYALARSYGKGTPAKLDDCNCFTPQMTIA